MIQENETKSSTQPPSVSEPPVASDSVGDDISNHNDNSNTSDSTDAPTTVVSPSSNGGHTNGASEAGTQTGEGEGQEQGQGEGPGEGSTSRPVSGQGPTATVNATATVKATANATVNVNANTNSAEGQTHEGKGVTAEHSPNVMYSFANPNANATATPLSPMHPHHMQHPYYYSQNVPNSPATPSYDSILGAQNSLPNNMFMRQHYPVIPPLSPHASNNGNDILDDGNGNYAANINHNLSMGIVPPASPLFPGTMPIFGSEQLESAGRSMNMMNVGMGVGITPNSPSLQYLGGPPPSPVISYGGIYPTGIQGSPGHSSWSDRPMQQQHMYPPTTPTPSPHIQSVQYQHAQSRRTTSFDGGELLPPSALEDNNSAVYSTSAGGATLFSQEQPWGYSLNPPPLSSLQQHVHPHNQINMHQMRSPQSGPRGGRDGQGGSPTSATPQGNMYFPAATPGPPIQTTHHNKGPEGANLFIFHIPNHFTNLDMWQLFCHYGTLLSVRIMVEKDTGRSRGFGFVSYDSPDAAALAIKELNGFVIGNKRLKVQHKQIRPGDKDHDQIQMKPPLLFTEGNAHGVHGGQGYGQGAQVQPQYPQGDVSGGYPGTHSQGGADGQLAQNQAEQILSLDTIGEALPEVAN